MTSFHGLRTLPSLSALLAISGSLLLTGCGKSTADVHGRVSVAGAPLTNVIVYFVPSSGPQAQSILAEDGTYQLTTPGKSGGAAPGTYKVYFAAATSEQDEAAKESLSAADYRAGKMPAVSKAPPKSPLPPKYRSLATSDLSRDVKPGSNEIDFELESH